MTWKQFKEEVDEQLTEMNIDETETVRLWYIDISGFRDVKTLKVEESNGEIAIS